jgi:hypothetical protein
VPSVVITVPLEGRTRAVLVAGSYEDENALAADLRHSLLLIEIGEALIALFDALDEGRAR